MAKKKKVKDHELIFLLFTAFSLVALATTILMLQQRDASTQRAVAGVNTHNQSK